MKFLLYNVFAPPIMAWAQTMHHMAISKLLLQKSKQFQPDIIVLNELFDKKTYKLIVAPLQKEYAYIYAPQYNNAFIRMKPTIFPPFLRLHTNIGNHGVVILSKHPFTLLKEITYNHCCHMDCQSKKGAGVIQLKIHDQQYVIVATHLQSFEVPILCSRVRINQLKLLQETVESLQKNNTITPEHIVVFIGDMNESNVDTLKTYLHAKPVGNNKSTTIYGKRFDYILYSNDFKKPTRAVMTRIDKMHSLSDHYMMMAEIL